LAERLGAEVTFELGADASREGIVDSRPNDLVQFILTYNN
jgi:hypothetical protein